MTEEQFDRMIDAKADRFEAAVERGAQRLDAAVERGARRVDRGVTRFARRYRQVLRAINLAFSLALIACFFVVPRPLGTWLGVLGILSLVSNALLRVFVQPGE